MFGVNKHAKSDPTDSKLDKSPSHSVLAKEKGKLIVVNYCHDEITTTYSVFLEPHSTIEDLKMKIKVQGGPDVINDVVTIDGVPQKNTDQLSILIKAESCILTIVQKPKPKPIKIIDPIPIDFNPNLSELSTSKPFKTAEEKFARKASSQIREEIKNKYLDHGEINLRNFLTAMRRYSSMRKKQGIEEAPSFFRKIKDFLGSFSEKDKFGLAEKLILILEQCDDPSFNFSDAFKDFTLREFDMLNREDGLLGEIFGKYRDFDPKFVEAFDKASADSKLSVTLSVAKTPSSIGFTPSQPNS